MAHETASNAPEVALETKKRRLHKLLENLSESSLHSQQSSFGNTISRTPVSATEAFDLARERATKRLRRSTSSSSILSNPRIPSTVSSAAHTKGPDAVGPPPNYSPWSHETFLARLRTFSSVSQWHPKPEAISEVEWAKRGWSCVDVNTVACRGGCENRAVVTLNPPKSTKDIKTSGVDESGAEEEVNNEEEEEDDEREASLEQALVERYREVMVSGHGPNCLWRKAGCKPDIYRLQVIRPSVWQPDLRKRFHSIEQIQQDIAKVQLPRQESDGKTMLSTERLLHDLPAGVLARGEEDRAANSDTSASQALELAIHGWRGLTESGSALLHCDACFQRIGLWMYQPDYRPTTRRDHTDESVDAPPAEENGITAAILDPTYLHRDHCPWRNAASQQALGTLRELNAAQVLVRIASTCARDHRRRTAENSVRVDHEGAEAGETASKTGLDEEVPVEVERVSKEEIAQQDRERESRLKKLKSLFSLRRKGTKLGKAAAR